MYTSDIAAGEHCMFKVVYVIENVLYTYEAKDRADAEQFAGNLDNIGVPNAIGGK